MPRTVNAEVEQAVLFAHIKNKVWGQRKFGVRGKFGVRVKILSPRNFYTDPNNPVTKLCTTTCHLPAFTIIYWHIAKGQTPQATD
jgi:hypothetical protein